MSRLAEVQRATIAMVYVCGDVEQRAVISRVVAWMERYDEGASMVRAILVQGT